MGHFALVLDGIVKNVICVSNEVLDNLPYPESEPVGLAFISSTPDLPWQTGTWWECSYNANFRGCYPGPGYAFDGVNFIPPVVPDPQITPADYTTQPEAEIVAP